MLHDVVRVAFAPWFEACVFACPPDRLPLVAEWACLVAQLIGEPSHPAMHAFRVEHVDLSEASGALCIAWEGAPSGPRWEEGLSRYRTDRRLVIEAATRALAVRSARWNSVAGALDPPPPAWTRALRSTQAPWFARGLDVPAGRADLVLAMALWVGELTGGPGGDRADVGDGADILGIEEEFGALRVAHGWPRGHAAAFAVTAISIVSHALCPACGTPARVPGAFVSLAVHGGEQDCQGCRGGGRRRRALA